jgi:hypothetical protein
MSRLDPGTLAELRTRYHLDSFIETGCYQGDGIAAALAAGFPSVCSCDINPDCVRHCEARFGGSQSVSLFAGDSLSALPEMLRACGEAPLVWLDAHFPAYYGLEEPAGTRFPVREELRLLAKTPSFAHMVILIDDIRVIEAEDNPRWRAGENPDHLVVSGLALADLTSVLESTHFHEVYMGQEGILVVTPRQSPFAVADSFARG